MKHGKRYFLLAAITLAGITSVQCARANPAPATQPSFTQLEDASYAVVISDKTYADPAWRKVADELLAKHKGTLIQYTGDVANSLQQLKSVYPRYAAFVATSAEAGRNYVVAIHRLSRRLNDDPYGDIIWGIVTGHSADDALRIASVKEPLVIRRAGGGTGINLDEFDSGKWFSEGHAGEYHVKEPGGEETKKTGEVDSTKEIVDFLNTESPDLFVTSGHASERNWMLGYGEPYIRQNGQFASKAGVMYGVDHQKNKYPVDSRNPKVFMAVGNCLMGHIESPNSMALAWMGSGGVDQFVGYTVVTWYGAMGWGVNGYLFNVPGRYDVAESFYFSNQSLLHDIATRYPRSMALDFEFPESDSKNPDKTIDDFAAALNDKAGPIPEKEMQNNLGLMWDRDVVAFYGDPAWDARLALHGPTVATHITHEGNLYHFTASASDTIKLEKPLAMLLPHRLSHIQIKTGQDLDPLVTDNFVMLFKAPILEKGRTYDVTFTAEEPKATVAAK